MIVEDRDQGNERRRIHFEKHLRIFVVLRGIAEGNFLHVRLVHGKKAFILRYACRIHGRFVAQALRPTRIPVLFVQVCIQCGQICIEPGVGIRRIELDLTRARSSVRFPDNAVRGSLRHHMKTHKAVYNAAVEEKLNVFVELGEVEGPGTVLVAHASAVKQKLYGGNIERVESVFLHDVGNIAYDLPPLVRPAFATESFYHDIGCVRVGIRLAETGADYHLPENDIILTFVRACIGNDDVVDLGIDGNVDIALVGDYRNFTRISARFRRLGNVQRHPDGLRVERVHFHRLFVG